MRILIVTHTFAPALNGQAVFSSHLAESLAARGHFVRVIVPAIDRPAFERKNGIEIQAIKGLDLRFIHKDLALAFALPGQAMQILREFQPQLVHFQDPAPISQILLWAARKLHIPTIATHHPGPAIWAPYLPGENWFVQRIIAPIIWQYFIGYLNRMAVVVSPSQASMRMLNAHGIRHPSIPVSCGVWIDKRSDQVPAHSYPGLATINSANKQSFLYVGRLDPEKRVDVLIEAFARIRNKSAYLLLAGSGASQESLQELVLKYRMQERVIFLGRVERAKIGELLAASDVFVMPGDSESLSIATLEAIAAGKPVIAANAMALPELVQDGWNGYLFAPGDAVDLAGKIDLMIGQQQLWPLMAARSISKAEPHTLTHAVESYVSLYQYLLSQPLPQPRPWLYPLPRWVVNSGWMLGAAQWAALLIILIISLVMRNHPVVAAPLDKVELINPVVIAEIKQFLTLLKHVNISNGQANGLLSLLRNLH